MSSTEDRATAEAILNAEGEAASRTFAYEPGEGEALWWLGMLATIKVTKEQTGGRYALVEILAPEGYEAVLHVHHQEDEGFYILEGEMTFYVGDQKIKAQPGSYLFGPKDVPHAFTVDSGPARLLFVLSPRVWRALSGRWESRQVRSRCRRGRRGRPMRPRWSGWPPSLADSERRSSVRRQSSRNAPPTPVRAGV